MKTRNMLSRIVCLLICFLMVFPLVACGGTVIDDGNDGKTKLIVKVSGGGYGSHWLDEVKNKFEVKHPEISVVIEKDAPIGAEFFTGYANEAGDVYFSEQVDNYFSLIGADYLLDITDVVTGSIEGQSNTIEDIMEETPKNYYGVKDDSGASHYYGLPWGNGFYGLNYDAEMFYNYGFYYTKAIDENQDIDNSVAFITPFEVGNGVYETTVTEGDKTYRKTVKNDILSHGPDGIYGTDDDGEPATYAEFFNLCDYMVENNIKPFVWMGNGSNYCMWFLASCMAPDYEGVEQTELAYNFDGTARNLIEEIRADGSIVKKAPTTISNDMKDKQIIYKSAGRYHALKFFEKVMERNGEEYVLHDSFTGNSFDHITAQETFMRSRKKNLKQKNKAAFLLDGCWWENETERNEKYKVLVEEFDESYSKENRMFKLLSTPKVDRNELGKPTYLDTTYLGAFIPKKISAEKAPLAKEFLKLAFSNESNIDFTKKVGLPRPYKYTLSEEDMSGMSSYAKSVWNKIKAKESRIAYPISGNAVYSEKSHEINPKFEFHSNINNTKYVNIFDLLITKGYSAKEIFDGIYTEAKIRIGN